MKYENLNEGVRTMIESGCLFLADYSEAVGQSGAVVNALRFRKDSEGYQEKKEQYSSKGYQECSPAVWFEVSTGRMSDDEASRFGEQAANS